jgi:hypothetical protein
VPERKKSPPDFFIYPYGWGEASLRDLLNEIGNDAGQNDSAYLWTQCPKLFRICFGNNMFVVAVNH